MQKVSDLSGLVVPGVSGRGNVLKAARTMAQLSHPQRLRVLCLLAEAGELTVGELLKEVPLSASALSQHLAKMREEGLVRCHREAKTVVYAIGREDIRKILDVLHGLYCRP